MSFSAEVGDTLYLLDGSQRRHLRIILTAPNEGGEIVIVNFTEAKYGRNNTVVFTPKDGPVFEKDTTVRYSDALLVSHKALLAQGKQEAGTLGDICPLDIIEKIVIGAFKSRDTPGKIIRELQVQYPILYARYYST